jgi:hypothetical protein
VGKRKVWRMDKRMQMRMQKVKNMFHFMNRLYCPNMEVIQPRIAKLWAKEKCDARTDGCRCGCRKWRTCFISWTDYTVQIWKWYSLGLRSCEQNKSGTDGRTVGIPIVPLFEKAGDKNLIMMMIHGWNR